MYTVEGREEEFDGVVRQELTKANAAVARAKKDLGHAKVMEPDTNVEALVVASERVQAIKRNLLDATRKRAEINEQAAKEEEGRSEQWKIRFARLPATQRERVTMILDEVGAGKKWIISMLALCMKLDWPIPKRSANSSPEW